MENISKFYLILAAASTMLFILKLVIFTFLGSDSEVHLDSADIHVVETDTSFNFLSIQSILAFLMGFGWTGLAALDEWGLSAIIAFFIALFVGLVFMLISAFLMYQVKKLNSASVQNYNDALNRTGKAYTTFAPNGSGKVQVEINGKLMVTNALSTSEETINSFELIKVIKVEEYILYIEKLQKGKI